jgi:hypothetical protein
VLIYPAYAVWRCDAVCTIRGEQGGSRARCRRWRGSSCGTNFGCGRVWPEQSELISCMTNMGNYFLLEDADVGLR